MATFHGQLLNRRQVKAFLVLPRLFLSQESAILHANHKSYIEYCINFYFNRLDYFGYQHLWNWFTYV